MRIRFLTIVLGAALLGTASPATARAWSTDGHRLVCEIAWRRLTPAAQRLVTQIRAKDPRPENSFAESCLWADEVRSTTHRHTYNYHFINIPPRSAPSMTRDCGDPEKRCAPWAIRHYAEVLRDRSASDSARAEALKFLAHFVGDLHQPLHAGRLEDLGGNEIKLAFFGRLRERSNAPPDSFSLHGIWDNDLVRRASLRWPDSARALSVSVSTAQRDAWSTTNVLRWTTESYRLSEDFAYPAVPRDRNIGRAYYERARPIIRQRLQQAGVRLAHLLNGIAAGTLTWPS